MWQGERGAGEEENVQVQHVDLEAQMRMKQGATATKMSCTHFPFPPATLCVCAQERVSDRRRRLRQP